MPPRLTRWWQARAAARPGDRGPRRPLRSKILLAVLVVFALLGLRSAADWLGSPTTLAIGGLSLQHPFAAGHHRSDDSDSDESDDSDSDDSDDSDSDGDDSDGSDSDSDGSDSDDDSGSSRGGAAAIAPEPAAPTPAGGQPVALVYDNPPFADDDNAQELGGMLQKSKYRFHVVYVGPKHTALTADLLGHSALFAFPGGDVETETAKRDFAQEIPLVQKFVADGGHYLGVCAGGFVAGADGFGVFPGEVGSYIDSPGAQFTDDKDHAVQITWRGQQQRSVDFQDGNYIKIPPGTPGVTVLGTYNNGLPAAAVATHGRGKAAFTGPHFESATDDDKHPAALDLDWQLLDTLMSPSNTPS